MTSDQDTAATDPTPQETGKLIVIEGIDGTGKSTQATMLAEALRKQGHEVVQSHEPTDGPWGKKLRESATTGRLTIEQELEYFLKDREQHVEELILPTVFKGGMVILDRYYFSSMAYQGARGIDPQEIRQKNEAFAPLPHILIILDLDVDTALDRIGVRDGEANEFEKRDALQFCRDLFLGLADEPFAHVIDASQEIEAVHREVLELCKS
ncbi:dTMP kinase [Verrucomicrobiaceae bacterium 5K15]|uniref:Thymidylate kinase n=1 Tax=Oceaniferula flava TaxID=2800421 RepID=A0AAE2SD77_9BACT|nr:dTMP kinase [Oceaniferula flavus]MBK1855728.1 dTMP kinase [Oceaniferula flavus]MBM1137035.1 dTMP kinase [Oceaniferula flavus]